MHDPTKYSSFRRKPLTVGIDAVYGILEGGGTEIQALRFNKDKFTPEQARDWLKEHNFKPLSFEPAVEKEARFQHDADLPAGVQLLPKEARADWLREANMAQGSFSVVQAAAWIGLRKAGWARRNGAWVRGTGVGKRFDLAVKRQDDEKRQVFGWAIPLQKDGSPVTDLQGDMVDLPTLEFAAYDFVLHSREAGEMHEEGDKGRLIESFVASAEKYSALGVQNPDADKGWWVGFVLTEDTYKRVKSGALPMFSIQGVGERVAVSE